MIVTNYKAIGRGSLVGSFTIDLSSGFRIADAMVMQKDDRMWISFPGIPFQKEGQTKYKNVIEIPDRDRRDRFNEEVLRTLREGGHIQ